MVLESNTLDVLFVKDGQQGEDGKVLYTWIKYAKDANGTGMTDDPNGAIYIGISYNNESSIESNDPTQYAWTKIQGADGKKGEDAYTIFLENENISFATDKNRNPLSEQAYTSGITIMKGAKPVTDFIIGDIAKTQGIAVAKTDTAIAISVVNGNPLPNDSGEIEIPITVGGTVFKKILTWTCAKKGDQGEQGERGLQGIQGPQGIQGVAGKDGTNGKTAYFHIKYSSVANPTSSSQLTETPSTYIGTYVDFTETDSTDPKKYTWSQFVGSQGPKGEQGIAGVGVDGKTSYLHIAYANSADGKTGFSTSDSTNKSYIGQYTDFTPNDSTDYTKYSWSLIRGKDGTDGVSPTVSVTKNGKTTTITITDKNGTHTQTVKDGTDGTPGQTGKDGKTTYFHVKYSNDGGQTFTSNSGEDVGAYIGTCTDYNQADPTTVGAYTWARIKGEKGDQGVRGEKGKDGTSVTITNKSITYQLSTSGTTIPTGTWQTSPQTIPEGQYQWTKTSVTYSDGNKTESYSISYHGKNGSNGTSVKTTSTSVKYQVGDSGTTKPTGTWQANVPTVVQGKYLWTQTIVNYSDGNSTESYSVAYRGIDGNNGVNGMNAATIYLYQRATSTPNKPSNTLTYTFSTTKITGTLNNGWSTAIPTGTDAVYVTVASVSSKNDTATIATSAWSAPVVLAQNGKTGSDGKAGLNVATIYLYQRNTSKPSKPSASVTYTFSTGVASGLNNGWSQKIPDGTNPLYVTLATASSNTATDTILSSEWSDVVVMAQNGEDGISPKVSLSKSGNTTTISIIDATGTHTQTVKDGTNGTPGAAGKDGKTSYFHVKYSNDGGKTFTSNSGEDTGIYMGSYTDYTETDSTDVKKYNWVKVKGDKGDTGQKGQNAKNLSITPSSQYFKSTDGGKTFAPNTITIKPTIQGEISFGKWQYSIDGGISFADVVSEQKGLMVSNNVLTVSKDSSLYSDAVTMVTFRAVASDSSFYDTCSIAKIYDVSDIGDGRNLWITRDNITLQACEKDKYIYTTTGTSAVCIGATGSSVGTNTIALQTGTKYTISFVISSPSEVGNAQWYFCTALNSTGVKNYGGYGVKLVTGENIVSQTITVDTSCDTAGLVLYNLPTGCVIKDIQVEKGSSHTGWTPAPEDVQTAILSTKSEISDVSLKVDKNKQAIEQRVEKTTYQQDLNLVKGDISKANEGLNKWRYEIYPKSLFASEYQGKSTMDVFAKNTNLTPSQSVLINDTDFGKSWAYGDNYIGYALTFVKFSAAKSVAITFKHDDGAHLYLNGKLIGGDDTCNTSSGESLTLSFIQGWNCLEVVLNEKSGGEYIGLGTTISALSECQLMNCYYGTPVARQSHITNQLVENMTNINGISTKVSKVMSVIGEDGKNFTDFKNDYSDFKQTMNGFKTTVGQTYVTKDDFNGLEIGGRNLLLYSQTIRAHNNYYGVSYLIDEVETFNGCPVWSVKDQWGKLAWSFKSHVIDRGLVKVGDTLTYSLYAKTNNASGKSISCSYRFKGNAQAYWFKGSAFNIGTSWARYSATFTVTKDMLATDTYMNEIGFEETVSMSGDDKVYFACPKLERGTKATDYTEAPEDDKINGQNLVSNLPSNWEQGTVSESSAVGTTYANTKSSNADTIRPKELIPVHGDITISAAYSNQSKKPIRHWIAAYDINKNYLGQDYVLCAWNDFPQTLNMKDAKYIAIMVGYTDGSPIAPSDISQICLKIERGTSATPFTLAPEDVNGKIVNVETIANQTANKFEWIVKSGDSSSNFTLTDRVADLVAERINFKGLVTFSGLSTDAKNEIGKVAQSKVDGLEVGGRNLLVQKNITEGYLSTDGKGSFIGSGGGDQTSDWIDVSGNKYITVTLYEDFTNTNNSGRYCEYDADKNCINTVVYNPRQKSSIIIELKSNTKYIRVTAIECKTRRYKIEAGNKATDWTPAPEDVFQDATNKASQALTDAENYSSNAVNWVASNGSSTTSLNSMVKKWTDGAVSDTTQINGGWIKANTITASKIAVGDFTNYCQLDKDTASSYGFTATDDTKGVWFTASPIDRDKHISQWFTCEGGQKLYVEYDLSTTVKGKVEASDTDISYLTSGIMIYAANGAKQIVSYTRSKGVTATSDGAITHVSLVETLPADTRFFKVVLQTNGQGNTFSGTLKIRNPQVRKATTGKLIVDGSITADKIAANAITADKIATDAIKSHNYISSGGTQGSFLNLKDGSFTAPNLSWDLNGNLIAKNANLSGEITATKGKIGKYTITDQWLITGSGSTASGFGGNQAFWAGSSSSNDAPFRVGYNGKLYANGATISGDITATTGKIGDLTLKDGILTGTGSYSEPYTEDDDGTVTSTITTNYITKLFGKGLTIDSTVKYSDEDDVYSYKVSVLPDEISFTDGEEIGMLGAGGLQILQVNDNSDSYSSEANEVSLSSGASNFYYTTPVNQTTDKYLHVCFSADGASFMASQGDKFNSFDIGYSSAKYSGNFAANKFVYTGNSLNYVECLEANDTTNIYFHSNGYYSFRVNNEGNWSNETQSVYITGRGISVPGQIGLYSQEMSNYVARYYIAGSTKSTAIGNNSYQTRIYGSSVWANKAVSTSDVRLKQDFQSLDKFEDLYMQLQPVSFKYIDGYDKSEDRYFGLKAQPTEKLFEDMGENPDDYAMFNKFGIDHEDIKERIGYDVDFDEEHGLDYTNLITLNTHMVQKTRRELAELQKENAELKDMLKTIVKKINM